MAWSSQHLFTRKGWCEKVESKSAIICTTLSARECSVLHRFGV